MRICGHALAARTSKSGFFVSSSRTHRKVGKEPALTLIGERRGKSDSLTTACTIGHLQVAQEGVELIDQVFGSLTSTTTSHEWRITGRCIQKAVHVVGGLGTGVGWVDCEGSATRSLELSTTAVSTATQAEQRVEKGKDVPEELEDVVEGMIVMDQAISLMKLMEIYDYLDRWTWSRGGDRKERRTRRTPSCRGKALYRTRERG
jgi:hypothetical protein